MFLQLQSSGLKKLGFFKKPNPLGFWGFFGQAGKNRKTNTKT